MAMKPKYNMYDFLEADTTGYPSMYAIIGTYIPEMEGDFSTANLLNKVNTVFTDSHTRTMAKNNYKADFHDLSKMILLAANRDIPMRDKANAICRELSEEEVIALNNRLAEVCDESMDAPTLEDKIRYAKEHIDDPKTEALREAIINEAVGVGNVEELKALRHRWLHLMYVPIAANTVKAKYPGVERNQGAYEEWNQIEFVQQTMRSPAALAAYDVMYNDHLAEMEKHRKESALKRSLQGKRSICVGKELVDTLTKEEKNQIAKDGFETVWFDTKAYREQPKKGSVKWSIEPNKKPDLLCDKVVRYTNSGNEYQRVLAVSYGKFHYTDGIFDNSLVQPELVGVTRLGKDGMNTYFVLIPLDTISFRDTQELHDAEQRINFTIHEKTKKNGYNVINESQAVIRDGETSKRLFGVKNRKIPADLEDFTTKVFLSDEYLTAVVKRNSRYAGYISKTPAGPRIVGYDMGKSELDAARYAKLYPGKVGDREMPSLEAYCNSAELKNMHDQIVRALVKGEFEFEYGQEQMAEPVEPVEMTESYDMNPGRGRDD